MDEGTGMKKNYLLFRCHGEHAQATAQDAADFITGYFANWSQRVKVTIKPMERTTLEDDTSLPWDVYIETANPDRVNIAHAAGWSYLTGKEVLKKEWKGDEIPTPKNE
jgi:hypothetical protein